MKPEKLKPENPYRKDRFKNAAVGTGALAVGAGGLYAGVQAGRAAKAAGAAAEESRKAARNVRVISGGVRRTGSKIVRAGLFIKRQVAKIPGVRFSAIELADRKKAAEPLPSAVKAGISAAVSGAALGLIPALRKGTGVKKVLKSVATGAGLGATLGGGGTAIGTAILGQPRKEEGAPITKRAAIGGGIGGAVLGGAGVLIARKVRRKLPLVGSPARALVSASKTLRPAQWIRKTPLPVAAAIGAGGGLLAGAAHASDEGQQVDTINNLKKDKKKRMLSALPSRLRATIEFAIVGYEGGIPLTGKVARDRYVKKIRDEDLDRRDASILRAGAAGAAAGLISVPGFGPKALKRAAIGAAIGGAGVLGVRKVTERSRDAYGERSRGAKRAESAPVVAGVLASGLLASGRLKLLPRRLAATVALIELGKKDQPRVAATMQYTDGLRAYGDNAKLVDAEGKPTKLTQQQILNAAWRGGHQIRKTVRRSSNLVTDVADVAAGRRKTGGRKREWEKEYFRNGLLTAASAAGLLGHAVARRKIPRYRRKSDEVIKSVKSQISNVRAKADGMLGLAALPGRLAATVHYFDAYSEAMGWDVRDPRGKSARVFAPGSRKRVRRPADWHETKDGQRKILGALGVAGTVAALAGGIAIGRKTAPVKRLMPAVKSHQRPGYRTKNIAVISRRAFVKAGENLA